MKIKINEIECKQCGYKWTPRKSDVRKCANPKCQSLYFDVEKLEYLKRRQNNE